MYVVDFPEPFKTPLFMKTEQDWENITTVVSHPGVIVSHGYPFRYRNGELWRWDIFFDSSSFINLIVFNISFNQHKVLFDITQRTAIIIHHMGSDAENLSLGFPTK